jgi:hypothetical protein
MPAQLERRGILSQRGGQNYSMPMGSDPLATFEKYNGDFANSTASYVAGPPAYLTQGGASSFSYYNLTGKKAANADILATMQFRVGSGSKPNILLVEPGGAGALMVGIGFGGGNYWLNLANFNSSTPHVLQSALVSSKSGLFGPDGSTDYMLKVQKTGNVVTWGVYDFAGSALFDPDASDSYTLTGALATAFGSGVQLSPGFWMGTDSRIYSLTLDCPVV